MPIPDEQLEAFGEYYTSEFVKREMPWIRMVSFEEFVTRTLAERGVVLQ